MNACTGGLADTAEMIGVSGCEICEDCRLPLVGKELFNRGLCVAIEETEGGDVFDTWDTGDRGMPSSDAICPGLVFCLNDMFGESVACR